MNKPLVTLLLLLVGSLSFGQQKAESDWKQFIKRGSPGEAANTDSPFLLVTVDSNTKNELYRSKTIHIVRKLDEENYIIYLSGSAGQTKIMNSFSAVYLTNDLWKLSPALAAAKQPLEADDKKLYILKVLDIDDFKKKISAPIKVINSHLATNTMVIESSHQVIADKLLPSDQVIYIDLFSGVPHEESLVLDMNLNVNKINLLQHVAPELNGDGLTMSVKEQRFDETDIDFKGRVLSSDISGETTSRHATEMATIAAGGGNTSPNSRGPAWGALLSSSNFEVLFPDNDSYFSSSDITIQNHSYGTIIENFYGAFAEAYDKNTNDNPKLLHVFSVGNNGKGTDTMGTYKDVEGFANLTGNFKMAKNILTVGAIDTLNRLDPFVSKGPAYDGRVKPEVVAYSTAGSSSSAALVSGLSVILQDAYRQKNGGKLPDATLLKTILINTADDAGPTGIDFLSGYGSVNAYRALKTINSTRHATGTIDHGESQIIDVTVPANARHLKITLAWNDPATTVNASTALVNDLDLSAQHESGGSVWLPWVLNSYPHKDSLIQLPQRKADRLNNIEQITIDNPEAGIYQVTVNGHAIPLSPQKYFVAYQWETQNDFLWTFPTGSDNVPFNGEKTSIFRWESAFGDATGTLEYSLDNGSTWQAINNDVDLSNGYLSWSAPDIHTTAIAKMTIGDNEFLTDVFTISRPLRPTVGFNCQDSVMLNWNNLENTDSYILYTLGNKYLVPMLETQDTAVILDKKEHPAVLYTVAPQFNGGKSGLRSLTFNYAFQGVDCYLSTFYAIENLVNEVVDLTLALGTTYGITKVIFEREFDGNYVIIHTIDDPQASTIVYSDKSPFQGLNTYRARILFDNGAEITSEPVAVYFLTELPVLTFPNPVDRSEDLNVFTKDFSGEPAFFKLMNTNGQIVLEYELVSERESISIAHLKAGLYLFSLTSEGVNHSGRIMIR
ncbi:hypothetical protein C900_02663 [Fulvivirga imtechensis AK7]|uniref:Uncharacterized protein n=1 Tax=Fulvivirga imtechensis AK7 TaxID=1237149 RepID=L8JZJ1_9BACT|nr:S8 family serine peptidase [Fulvivirga imtechensis]ELR73578.1 hypothetical protein C900_02663 [Fulvivirga imtechensis AK7]